MTRIQIVASLSEDVRKRFITNIVDCNEDVDIIDRWMNNEDSNRGEGIYGAFTFSTTREGHNYWAKVNANLKK